MILLALWRNLGCGAGNLASALTTSLACFSRRRGVKWEIEISFATFGTLAKGTNFLDKSGNFFKVKLFSLLSDIEVDSLTSMDKECPDELRFHYRPLFYH
jgi:hypothetical protein